jgi:poly(3-hydroxybutyrate) depolymerase
MVVLVLVVSTVSTVQRRLRARSLSEQQRDCATAGWAKVELDVNGYHRELLWKGPARWRGGAILALHGGSGSAYNFCYRSHLADSSGTVGFARDAIDAGFAVFALNSTYDAVRDDEAFRCGKVWDDEVRDRPNVDLPFIEKVIDEFVPSLRPRRSNRAIFITGLSSGGFMAIRAATKFGDKVAAFAPVSAGDPFGWYRRCDPTLGHHGPAPVTVWGKGYDRDTNKEISVDGACMELNPGNEATWDTSEARPPVLVSHSALDGVVDPSCHRRLVNQLKIHGYPTTVHFLTKGGPRTLADHLWQPAYTRPILDFFTEHSRDSRPHPYADFLPASWRRFQELRNLGSRGSMPRIL